LTKFHFPFKLHTFVVFWPFAKCCALLPIVAGTTPGVPKRGAGVFYLIKPQRLCAELPIGD